MNQNTLVTTLLVVGIAAIAFSLLAPSWWDGRRLWSDEQAERFQRLSGEVHVLSFASDPQDIAKLHEIKREFAELKDQLKAVRSGGQTLARVLQVLGGLSIIGALLVSCRGTAARRST